MYYLKLSLFPFIICALLSCGSASTNSEKTVDHMQQPSSSETLTYLALGDSYTIGEGVSESQRFPNQLVDQLNSETNNNWGKPKIIAQTGWTVEELAEGINKEKIDGSTYDLVTLLIGVNNQYRGRSVESYKVEFEKMLARAIDFAGGDIEHVVVISIPNWGITPFAQAKNVDLAAVEKQIHTYNQVKREICEEKGIVFVDISAVYNESGAQIEMLAEDELHPSGQMYENWINEILPAIKNITY